MKVPVIAIVDDDASFRKAAASFIRSLGHIAVVFSSAEEFLGNAQVDETQCLITDVQMPGMTGLELQSQLAAQGYRLPIIFVSAFPEMKARDKALAAGALAFLDKPFSDEKLVAALHEALSARRI